jgi:hypothetical protein
MSATLKVVREVDFAIELRRGTFEVVVDNEGVGTVQIHESLETPIAPGLHTLRIRHGRYSSKKQSFDASDGEVLTFRCHGANIWPTYVASIVAPSLAITIKRA